MVIRPDPPNRLRELRRLRGLTQKALGAGAAISAQQIGHLERGERRMTFDQAARLAPRLGCAPADLMADAAGLSVPLTCHVAAAFATADGFDVPEPRPLVATLPSLAAPERCFAADVLDDSADRLYPPGSVLVLRRLDGAPARLAIGAKVLVRRYLGRRAEGRTMEILTGLLERGAAGELVLALRSTNRALPASVAIQAAPGAAGLGEAVAAAMRHDPVADYAAADDDPAEIIGVVTMAITPE